MGETVTLYRPVGEAELALIRAADMRAFPPRLPQQPIFYPVTNERYATEITARWNATQAHSPVGYVLRFEVDAAYLAQFERQVVGRSYHEEYWIPAERLDEFNRHIVGRIEVLSEHRGDPPAS